MEITKKNRSELKSYFLTNKIPTQKNFEEFIDAGLNQTDDGIMKGQGRPLALQAEGDDSGTQEVLQLYKKLVDNNPRWSINLNPRTDPNNTTTGKLGLNISDAAGVSRFFIKGDDGNVGIGTITPAQKLHVQVSNNGLNLPLYVRNANGTEGGNAVGIAFLNEAQGDWPKAAVVHERTAGFGVGSLRFLVNGSANNNSVTLADTKMTIHSNGNVGIGSVNPGVPLTFTDSLGDKISLWGQAGNTYGFGIQPGLLQIHTSGADGDIAFGYGSSASLVETVRIKANGNLGLGTNAPQAKLHVLGGAIMPSSGNSATSGITFPANPGGGGGDTAYIRYYARSGESTTLEIGVGNDADDNIALMTSGNIGINTVTPGFPLTFPNSLGDKISLWGQSGAHYGFGIQGALLQIHSDSAGADIAFGYGTSSALNETARIKGNGHMFITGGLGVGMQNTGDIHTGSRMQGGGNVVMRSTAPQIDFVDTEAGHGHWAIHVNASRMYFIREPWNFSDLVLDGKGNVGIGTDSPVAKLHVNGYNNTNYGGYYWLAQRGTGDNNGNNIALPASILASHRIVAGEFNANSDLRIKKDVSHADPAASMAILSRLRIADFRYKDEVGCGNSLQKGLIAQDVEHVFPEAVTVHPDFVPDIYSMSESAVVHGGMLTVAMKEAHGLETGDIVRLISELDSREVPVAKVTDKIFTVDDWENNITSVFVYGRKVPDFRTVNYNSVFSLGLSAIQELYLQVQQLKEELFGVKEVLSARLTPAG